MNGARFAHKFLCFGLSGLEQDRGSLRKPQKFAG